MFTRYICNEAAGPAGRCTSTLAMKKKKRNKKQAFSFISWLGGRVNKLAGTSCERRSWRSYGWGELRASSTCGSSCILQPVSLRACVILLLRVSSGCLQLQRRDVARVCVRACLILMQHSIDRPVLELAPRALWRTFGSWCSVLFLIIFVIAQAKHMLKRGSCGGQDLAPCAMSD